MGDLIAWLLSFFILIAVLALVLYQLMCFLDLETDYINPYELATKINSITLPEFITQGVLCFLHLVTGHWFMFLLCLPYLCYNVNLYIHKRHLVYATEVFGELSREKKQRIFKLDDLEYRGYGLRRRRSSLSNTTEQLPLMKASNLDEFNMNLVDHI